MWDAMNENNDKKCTKDRLQFNRASSLMLHIIRSRTHAVLRPLLFYERKISEAKSCSFYRMHSLWPLPSPAP